MAAMLGCATPGSGFRERAEDAFRRQNRLSAEFMVIAPDIEVRSPKDHELLLAEEKSMLDACRPLNSVASSRRAGEHVRLSEKRSIVRGLGECEQAIGAFEDAFRPWSRW